MSGKPRYQTPPARPVNQWVRDVLAHTGMNQASLADALTRVLGVRYDRSKIQKMTVSRRVTPVEINAISTIADMPSPVSDAQAAFIEEFQHLPDEQQVMITKLMREMRGQNS